MEDLNKTQLILLTLLVSFVTSIATGIITVSLLQEAPQGVTQTINRVVQQTIEKVVPVESGGTQKVKEVTVIVKEEDLVIDAINKNAKNIVRIKDTALVDGVSLFYGLGFLVSKDGIIVSDRRENLSVNNIYLATFSDGISFQMRVVAYDDNASLTFFQIIKDQRNPIPSEPAILATKELQLGQTVIAIEGDKDNVVSIGRVVSFGYGTALSGGEKPILSIKTDISPKTKTFGGPLVNLNGEIVGIRTTYESTGTLNESYVSLGVIKSTMAKSIKK